MKRPSRPFAVEIRATRRPAQVPGWENAVSGDGLDPFPEDLPVRDVHEDVAARETSEALREAERVFGGGSKVEPAPAPGSEEAPATSLALPQAEGEGEPRPRRVLPDLLALARAEPLPPTEPAPLRSPRRAAAPRKRPPEEAPAPVEPVLPLETASAAEASMTVEIKGSQDLPPPSQATGSIQRHRRSHDGKVRRLPAGERWKERRLPHVCWPHAFSTRWRR